MKLALDTQLVLRTQARRILTGAAEVAGASVIIPETAAFFAKLHYHHVARPYVAKRIAWRAAEAGIGLDGEAEAAEATKLLNTVTTGFTRWLDEEPRRNDAMIGIGRRESAANVTAMELSIAGVVSDPSDHRWGVGEDPYVIAEALHAGAHWIATENLKTIEHGPMEQWLDKVQREGRFTHVPRPFVLSADGAVRTLLNHRFGQSPDQMNDQVMALASAITQPRNPTLGLRRRLGILTSLSDDLRSSGLIHTAGALSRWLTKAHARLTTCESEVQSALEALNETVPVQAVERTRASEDRRLRAEAGDARTQSRQATRGPERGR